MGFDFEKAGAMKQPDGGGKKLDGKTSEYRARAKADKKRYMMAVNSNYWVSLSFRSEAARDSVAALLEADGNGYAFGDRLRAVSKKPEAMKRGFARKREKLDDPAVSAMEAIAAHESDGTLNGDALAMAAALMDSFESGFSSERSVYSSKHRIVVIFRDEEDVKSFCRDYGLESLDPPYLDGDAASKELGLA